MEIFVSDSQICGEVESTMFTLLQQGPITAPAIIRNAGANTINYRFQESVNGTWTDMDVQGTDMYNTLSAGQVKVVTVASNYAQVRLLGYASGGAIIEFSITRWFNRASGGNVPILSL